MTRKETKELRTKASELIQRTSHYLEDLEFYGKDAPGELIGCRWEYASINPFNNRINGRLFFRWKNMLLHLDIHGLWSEEHLSNIEVELDNPEDASNPFTYEDNYSVVKKALDILEAFVNGKIASYEQDVVAVSLRASTEKSFLES
jgi:hypothetical protein